MKKILLFVILILLTSCNTKKGKKETLPHEKPEEMKRNLKEHSNPKVFSLEFPDTIKIKTWTPGKLIYLEKDSSNISDRYVFFHVIINKDKKELKLKEIKKIDGQITFADTIGNGHISFETGSDFRGENFFHGVIEDIGYLKDSPKNDTIKKVVKQVTITKQVYVKK